MRNVYRGRLETKSSQGIETEQLNLYFFTSSLSSLKLYVLAGVSYWVGVWGWKGTELPGPHVEGGPLKNLEFYFPFNINILGVPEFGAMPLCIGLSGLCFFILLLMPLGQVITLIGDWLSIDFTWMKKRLN